MRLRPATAADADVMAALHVASFDSPWSAADIAVLIGGPGGCAILGEDAAPVGFVLVRALPGEAEVLTLAVDPARRRQGAGRALMEAALALALANGSEAMFLEVAVDNAPAIGLYRALGFEQAGRRRGYYRRPGGAVDAVVLRRALNT